MKKALLILILCAPALFAQKVIEVVPGYVVIDTDEDIGEVGERITVYRDTFDKIKRVGVVKILRFEEGKTVAETVTQYDPHRIEVGDFVYRRSSLFRRSTSLRKGGHGIIGYAVNVPHQYLGFHVIYLSPKYPGFYVDFRIGVGKSNEANFLDDVSVYTAEEIFGDTFQEEAESSWSLSLGVTQTVFSRLAVFLGASYSSYSFYRQYYDKEEILGSRGYYWVKDSDKKETGVGVLGGVIFVPWQRLVLCVGPVSRPAGVLVGAGFLF